LIVSVLPLIVTDSSYAPAATLIHFGTPATTKLTASPTFAHGADDEQLAPPPVAET
jgi:hypothetical protein